MSIGNFDTARVSLHTTVSLWVCVGTSIALGVYSALCPPKGVIDSSILTFAPILGFFASLAIIREAIKEGRGIKIQHNGTAVEVNDNDDTE